MKHVSKGKEKPVWRAASGELPYGVNDVAYIYRGEVFKGWVSHRWLCAHEWYHIGRDSGEFYNTNRTKAAKYERASCNHCDGLGWWRTKISFTPFGQKPPKPNGRQCEDCNGKGYKMERIK